jgi:hypothetical protein
MTFRLKGSRCLHPAIVARVGLRIIHMVVAQTSVSLMATPLFKGEALLLADVATVSLPQASLTVEGLHQASLTVKGLNVAGLAVGKLLRSNSFWCALKLGLLELVRLIFICLFVMGIILLGQTWIF